MGQGAKKKKVDQKISVAPASSASARGRLTLAIARSSPSLRITRVCSFLFESRLSLGSWLAHGDSAQQLHKISSRVSL